MTEVISQFVLKLGVKLLKMKHFYTLLCLLISFNSFAQIPRDLPDVPKKDSPSVEHTRAGGDTNSAWVNYGRTIYELGGARSYFRNYLYPDTGALVEFSGGYSTVWKHSFGEVLDPNSVWLRIENIKMDDTSKFRLDSVAINYRYFRWNDNVPDTLRIQVYDKSKIRFRRTSWQSGASYANVEYDHIKRRGSSPTQEIVYLLDNKDTALFAGQKTLKFPVNMTFDTGLVAASYTFYPGEPSNIGDTIDVYIDPLATKKVNAFIVYEFRDEVPNVLADEGNNGLTVTSSVRYNYNTNGWNGRYQPGTSWASSSGIYHSDMAFHISYIEPKEPVKPKPTGMSESDISSVSIYPNPVREWLSIKVVKGKWNMKVFNTLGVEVASQEFDGDKAQVDLNALPRGNYMIALQDQSGQSYFERIFKE